MRNLTATICLAVALLFGSAGVSWSAEPIKGYCLFGTKHSHYPIAGKCSVSYERGDYKTALRGFKRLANKGNAAAQYNLGQMYRDGEGVSKNYKTAVKWYKLAAKQGNAFAQLNLGELYRQGQGVPQDYKTAVKWHRLAAEQGLAYAQHNLGEMYRQGQGVPQDYKTAAKWWTLAAEQGIARAQLNLGLMYDNGLGVPQNDKIAVKWYTLAAEQGVARAQKELVNKVSGIYETFRMFDNLCSKYQSLGRFKTLSSKLMDNYTGAMSKKLKKQIKDKAWEQSEKDLEQNTGYKMLAVTIYMPSVTRAQKVRLCSETIDPMVSLYENLIDLNSEAQQPKAKKKRAF